MEKHYQTLAITEASFAKFIELELAFENKLATLTASDFGREDEEDQSRLLTMYDNVGVIEVKGMMVNTDSFWNRIFGRVSYNEIRAASIQAVERGSNVIVYDYDTPGGNVNGMSDTANLISSLEPHTISFTSGSMASAGYFLGSQSDDVYADTFAEVGSVGIVAKIYDRSKMLDNIGIKPMRFRSGDLKAVGDPDFKMSAKEKTYIQGKIDNYGNKFFSIVSDARGMPLQALEKAGITSGRTFIGEEALEVNLVDANKSFDEVMLQAFTLAKKAVDKRTTSGLF